MYKNIYVMIFLVMFFFISSSTTFASTNWVTTNLSIGAVINTVEKGDIDAVWKKGGEDTTSRGDRVIWGHFYASPSDVTWGSENNPDLFVKIWFDVSGRIDVNYFHVSVPDIRVYSEYTSTTTSSQNSTCTMSDRYYRHEYNSSSSPATEDFTGEWTVVVKSTTDYDIYMDPCGNAVGTMSVTNNQFSLILYTGDHSVTADGNIGDDGTINTTIAKGLTSAGTFSGKLSGNSGNGTWEDIYECSGTWTATKQ